VVREYERLITAYPEDIRDVLKRLKDGRFESELSMPTLKDYVEEITTALNKVAAALVVSAVILGLFLIGRGQGGRLASWLPRAIAEFWWVSAILLLIVFYFRKR
jgi:hypothetical protein